MQPYQPAEDSYLMSETLKEYLINLINKYNPDKKNQKNQEKSNLKNFNINDIMEIKILDMGSGSGIQAETCRELGLKNLITADINPAAVKLLKSKGFKSIKTDLFSNINKKSKFNIILFNPPYLPENEHDKEKDTTSGKKGYELIIDFLEQAKSYLQKDGKILLLFSSLSKPAIIKKQAKILGYNSKLLSKKHLFFEELFVYEFSL
ncbi:MAG: DUF2431 domain-containing protein [Candidatus Nanoarchaeia archaeon]|nr:DUF2431 domain-containing protein [Candidatus Nanoarchaeia archaeon]